MAPQSEAYTQEMEDMTPEKVKSVVEYYRQQMHWIAPQEADKTKTITGEGAAEHVRWMLDRIDEFVDEGRIEKAFRWLGFVQGVLWLDGRFSIDEMRHHNVD